MFVRDLMRREVVTLDATDQLDLADGIMRPGRIRHLPVVSGGRVVGIPPALQGPGFSRVRIWFRRPAHRMAAQPEKYRKLGAMDLTLVPRITFPDRHIELYSLAFEGHSCRPVE